LNPTISILFTSINQVVQLFIWTYTLYLLRTYQIHSLPPIFTFVIQKLLQHTILQILLRFVKDQLSKLQQVNSDKFIV